MIGETWVVVGAYSLVVGSACPCGGVVRVCAGNGADALGVDGATAAIGDSVGPWAVMGPPPPGTVVGRRGPV